MGAVFSNCGTGCAVYSWWILCVWTSGTNTTSQAASITISSVLFFWVLAGSFKFFILKTPFHVRGQENTKEAADEENEGRAKKFLKNKGKLCLIYLPLFFNKFILQWGDPSALFPVLICFLWLKLHSFFN